MAARDAREQLTAQGRAALAAVRDSPWLRRTSGVVRPTTTVDYWEEIGGTLASAEYRRDVISRLKDPLTLKYITPERQRELIKVAATSRRLARVAATLAELPPSMWPGWIEVEGHRGPAPQRPAVTDRLRGAARKVVGRRQG